MAVLTNQDAIDAAGTIARLAAPIVAGYPLAPADQQALDIYRGLQQGRIDRSLLAPNLSDYFTPEALADFESSLAPLGEPLSVRQTRNELRGGMTFRSFAIVYPAAGSTHHLHLSRRQTGTVPHRAGGVTHAQQRNAGAMACAPRAPLRATQVTKLAPIGASMT